MRAAAVAAAVLAGLAVACADAASTRSASETSQTISYWQEGRIGGNMERWTLRCEPTGGTHPARARACSKLDELTRPFAPVPKDAVCTQVFGGPQEALVTGTFRGRSIWARFNRRNGCQIPRWNRHVPLVPSAAA